MLRWRGGEITGFAQPPRSEPATLTIDRQGRPCFFSASSELRCFDGQAFVRAAGRAPDGTQSRSWLSLLMPDGSSSCDGALESACREGILQTLVDRRGRTWVATAHALHLRERGARQARALTSADGLPDNHVVNLIEDREGGIWLHTHGGALARLEVPPVLPFTARHGLAGNTPFALSQAQDGALWIASVGGLTRWHDGVVTNYRHKREIPNQPHHVLARRDGSVWMSTYHDHLMRLRDGQVDLVVLPDRLSTRRMTALFEDPAGTLWVGTTEGQLYRQRQNDAESGWEAVRPSNCPMRSPVFHDDRPCTTAVSALSPRRQGGLWVATYGDGLWTLDQGTMKRVHLPGQAGPGVLFAVLEDEDGTVWLGSDGGLLRWRGDTLSRFGRGEGLIDPVVHHLVDDTLGSLWYVGGRGIVQLRRADLEAYRPGTHLPALHLDARDGLPSHQVMSRHDSPALRARDGRLWFTTVTGMAIVDPTAFQSDRAVPTLLLDGVGIDGRWRFAPDLPAGLEGPPGTAYVEIRLTAGLFDAAHQTRFQYQLVGVDRSPSQPTTAPSVQYAHVAPGKYVLEARAFREDRPDRAATLRLPITIRPRFHQTPLFRMGIGLLAALAIAGDGGRASAAPSPITGGRLLQRPRSACSASAIATRIPHVQSPRLMFNDLFGSR